MIKLPKEAIIQLQVIYKEELGIELSFSEAQKRS